MSQSHRREFLQEVGGGMLACLVGTGLAAELGLAAEDGKDGGAKTPAGLARLSQIIQQTPTKDLLPALARQLKDGTSLKELIAAGALANARAFGGQAGADQAGQHAPADLLQEFATIRLRHRTPPSGSGHGNRLPIPLTTPGRYTPVTSSMASRVTAPCSFSSDPGLSAVPRRPAPPSSVRRLLLD